MQRVYLFVGLFLTTAATMAMAQDSDCSRCTEGPGASELAESAAEIPQALIGRIRSGELATPKDTPVPGGLSLPAGYTHAAGVGFDTRIGTIFNADGLEIRYDIGLPAGNYANAKPEERRWLVSRNLESMHVDVALRRDRTLIVTFVLDAGGYANFYAQIDKDEDIAEMLLIVLGYQP